MTKQIAAITGDELRKALAEVEKAEAAGFVASQAVFYLTPKNRMWSDGEFVDIAEKAHPTDGSMDWGRDNFVVRRGFTFRDGRLVNPKHKYVKCTHVNCPIVSKHCSVCSKAPETCAADQKTGTDTEAAVVE